MATPELNEPEEEIPFSTAERDVYKWRPRDPYAYLGLAVIGQAIKDATRGSRSAVQWLLGTGLSWLTDLCHVNMDADLWRSMIINLKRVSKGNADKE